MARDIHSVRQEKGLNLLLVDDEKGVVNALKRELKDLNCSITTTTSGRKAMSVLREQAVALLITDHKMPDVNGVDLVRFANQYSPDTHVLRQ